MVLTAFIVFFKTFTHFGCKLLTIDCHWHECKALKHEMHIFYSQTEWYLLFSQVKISAKPMVCISKFAYDNTQFSFFKLEYERIPRNAALMWFLYWHSCISCLAEAYYAPWPWAFHHSNQIQLGWRPAVHSLKRSSAECLVFHKWRATWNLWRSPGSRMVHWCQSWYQTLCIRCSRHDYEVSAKKLLQFFAVHDFLIMNHILTLNNILMAD